MIREAGHIEVREPDPEEDLQSQVEITFGYKRILILRSDSRYQDEMIEIARSAAKANGVGFGMLDATSVKADDIRGEPGFVTEDGSPLTDEEAETYKGSVYSQRKQPTYMPTSKDKMVVVTGLSQATDMDVLYALWSVARSLPWGMDTTRPGKMHMNGLVLIGDSSLPLDRFASISEYWFEEARLLPYRPDEGKQGEAAN